jgi:hypothetical protein
LSAVGLGEAGVVGYLARMTTHRDPLFTGYRYPAELISYAVWLYFRPGSNVGHTWRRVGAASADEGILIFSVVVR